MALYNQKIYMSPYPYIVNNFIREYDLSAANINALLTEGIISVDKYEEFLHMPKMEREIKIGIMSRDKNIYKAIQRGIINAKKQLFRANNIQDHEVVSIKNDAVFVLGRELQYTEFGNYKFKMKNKYTIFMRLCDLEIYYSDVLDGDDISYIIDVKGINDDKLPLHGNGMLDLICETCFMLQRNSPDEVLRYVTQMYNLFLSRKLPVDFYREFNSLSGYIFIGPIGAYKMDYISEDMVNMVDINRNAIVFRDLINIVSNVYRSNTPMRI